jgi:predicted GIY-YIG superfamily endonuclease/predicted kinase
MAAAWVYMLRCRDGSLYTGWSTDVARRLARHRAGKASSYTASRLPVELAFVALMTDNTAARREEARIKALDRAGKLELIGHDGGMSERPTARSVKISDDERTGWSSDRPRRGGAPPRPADLTVHSRVLRPSDRLRYSPGSLLVVVSASAAERDRFLERLIEDRASLLSLDKVRLLLAGRVAAEELQERSAELLQAAVLKRLEAKETVVLAADSLEPEERERFVRMAAAQKRPRHLILLEAARDQVRDEDRAALNELRRALDAGELGGEGFQTVLRLGGGSASEVKRILFRPAPRDE